MIIHYSNENNSFSNLQLTVNEKTLNKKVAM